MQKYTMIETLETEKENNYLEVEVSYDEGGYNWACGTPKKRGFYLSVQPVEKKNGFECFTAFTGTRIFLFEVGRYSEKQRQKAIEVANERKGDLIAYVCADQNIKLKNN